MSKQVACGKGLSHKRSGFRGIFNAQTLSLLVSISLLLEILRRGAFLPAPQEAGYRGNNKIDNVEYTNPITYEDTSSKGGEFEHNSPPPWPPPVPPPPAKPKKMHWTEAYRLLSRFEYPHEGLDDESAKKLFMERLWAFKCFMGQSSALLQEWKKKSRNWRQRGILLPAGRSIAVTNAFVVLHVLRVKIKCRLPVAVAYYGEEELSEATRKLFRASIPNSGKGDLDFIDISKMPYPGHHVPLVVPGSNRRSIGYKLKVLALYLAPFEEIIWMDSDSIPLQDPESLFKLKAYREKGNVFWPDFWQEPVGLWTELGLDKESPWRRIERQGEPKNENQNNDESKHNGDFGESYQVSYDYASDGFEFEEDPQLVLVHRQEKKIKEKEGWPFQAEAGQGILNRKKYWKVLEWLMFLNTHDFFVYKHALGDKDTFRVAFEFAGHHGAYWQSPFAPSLPLVDRSIFKHDEDDNMDGLRFWNLGMLQLHPETGSPLFHHRTADSKFYPKVAPRDNLGPITHVTPSLTQDQASIMIWGHPGDTIYHSSGPSLWGLDEGSTLVVPCSGNTHRKERFNWSIFERENEASIHVLEHNGGDQAAENLVDAVQEGQAELEGLDYFKGRNETNRPTVSRRCRCNLRGLHRADLRCINRTKKNQELYPWPILAIEVPSNSTLWSISASETEAYRLIPFQEAMD